MGDHFKSLDEFGCFLEFFAILTNALPTILSMINK